MDRNIYEVTRNDYKGFVKTIKPEARDVRTDYIDDYHLATNIYSKKTNKILCGRVTDMRTDEDVERDAERYYIYNSPEPDESLPAIPTRKVVLETKEQVQALFDWMKRVREGEEENGRDI